MLDAYSLALVDRFCVMEAVLLYLFHTIFFTFETLGSMKFSVIRARLFVLCLLFISNTCSLVIVMCEWVVHAEANRRLRKGGRVVDPGRLRPGCGFDRNTVCFGERLVVAAGASSANEKIMHIIHIFDETYQQS